MYTTREKLIITTAMLSLVLIFVVILVSCGDDVEPPGLEVLSEEGIDARFFRLNGMPCFWVQAEAGAAEYKRGFAGMTCNWRDWNGQGGLE